MKVLRKPKSAASENRYSEDPCGMESVNINECDDGSVCIDFTSGIKGGETDFRVVLDRYEIPDLVKPMLASIIKTRVSLAAYDTKELLDEIGDRAAPN